MTPVVSLMPYLIVLATTALTFVRPWYRARRSKKAPEPSIARHGFTWLPRSRRPPRPDPFETLHVQTRLHVVAVEIRELEVDSTVFARAARLEARSAAYDALLRNACELAGVVDLDEVTGRDGRMHRELQLTERGWSW
jgi:hypothetical protein